MNSLEEIPVFVQALVAAVFGLLIGSFLNVVIYRVPRGESVAFPASHCGSCGYSIKPYDNIPVVSWLLLGGKCRSCRQAISWFYPAVELLTGVCFFVVSFSFGIGLKGLAGLFLTCILISLVFIDFRHQLLPDVITYPSMVIVGGLAAACATRDFLAPNAFLPMPATVVAVAVAVSVLLLLAILLYAIDRIDEILFSKYMELQEDEVDPLLQDVDERELVRRRDRMVKISFGLGVLVAIGWLVWAVLGMRDPGRTFEVFFSAELILNAGIGAVAGAGIVWFLRGVYFYTRGFGGMGLGDVKLMAVLGGFLGWKGALLILILGSLTGSVGGLLQIALKGGGKGLQTRLPFGIFLGIGAFITLLFGNQIVSWYAQFLPH